MNLKHNQRVWLLTRGGRNESDVIMDMGRPCIEVSAGRRSKKLVQIPNDDVIKNELKRSPYRILRQLT